MFYRTLEEFKKGNGYELDGIWYPRVTSIVSIKAKPALYRYYGDHKSFAHAKAAMNKSAEEGSLVHDVVEAILRGQEPVIPQSVDPVISEFLSFNQQAGIVAHKIETQVISKKHRYAGTLDVLAEINNKLGVLDIKTSQAIYRDYGIQTAAYVEALRENPSMPELTRWVLRLDQVRLCLNGCGARLRTKGGNTKIKNGRGADYYKSIECAHNWGPVVGEIELKELDGLEEDIQAFLAAKKLWEWEYKEWLERI